MLIIINTIVIVPSPVDRFGVALEKFKKAQKNSHVAEPHGNCVIGGGDKEDRTPDLLHAMQALSQLSYAPTLPGLAGR